MSKSNPQLMGVVNITRDSFSDGGLFLRPEAAIAHAEKLRDDGADIIDLGPASSHPDAQPVDADEEIRRVEPVLDHLMRSGTPVSIDSFLSETQRYAAGRGVDYLNDIQGFADPDVYADLAAAESKLIVMHSVQRSGKAIRRTTDPNAILDDIKRFFDARLGALEAAQVPLDRVILDPGMGFFLGSNPEPSLVVLKNIDRLKRDFGRPVLISVSRKSFLGRITGRETRERGFASVAAEIFAATQGVDYIRTHDVRAVKDGLAVWASLS